MKQRIILSVIIGIIVIGMTLWINTVRQNQREEDRQRIFDFNAQQIYVNFMRFENYFMRGAEDWSATVRFLEAEELIFVYSAEEARELGFSPNQITAWPSLYSIAIMEGINETDGVDFEAFGLTYPLTIEDLINNWQQVGDLWVNGISKEAVNIITGYASQNYKRVSDESQKIRVWLFPGRLDAFNALIEGQDISDFDIEAYNEQGWIDRTISLEDLPAWPITEEDVQTDVNLISAIASWLLTDEEYESIRPKKMIRSQSDQ